jgi:uncharacterized damage-inducible protein DinB
MIDKIYAQTMARYNAWQNRSLYREAGKLSEEERRHDRGAFFKSIHSTLSHLAWADAIWLARFTGSPLPQVPIADSPNYIYDWNTLAQERLRLDATVATFADGLTGDWLAGDLTWWSATAQHEISKPRWLLVTHMFNHQTHHRGQVHAMLTAAGAKPDATDLPFMPDAV